MEETAVRYTQRKGAKEVAGTKRKYDTAFKQEALRLLNISGKSVRQVEAELGITPGLLNNPRHL